MDQRDWHYKDPLFLFSFDIYRNGTVHGYNSEDQNKAGASQFGKINVTNRIFYDNALQFSYERVIKENQSIAVFGGYQEFKNFNLDITGVNFSKSSDRSGYSMGAEYRFYLGDLNKYSAPRGVYLAPYVSYYKFKNSRDYSYTDEANGTQSATLDTKIHFLNFGGELGYQFIIAKRFVVDCILFGPSFTAYKFEAKASANLSGLDDNEMLDEVIDKLKDRFPFLNDIADDGSASGSGVSTFESLGFRYSISIGYRF